jgi:virginiamycin B lyase
MARRLSIVCTTIVFAFVSVASGCSSSGERQGAAMSEYRLPAIVNPTEIFAAGDKLWVANSIVGGGLYQITIAPSSDPTFLRLQVGNIENAQVQGVVLAHDGTLWFTILGALYPEPTGPSFVGYSKSDGSAHLISLGTHLSPGRIVEGTGGKMWFTSGNSITSATREGIKGTYSIPHPWSDPEGIAVDSVGNVWFCELGANRLGRLDVRGHLTEFSLPTPQRDPEGIAPGNIGSMWFTERRGDRIGRISRNGQISEFQVPTPDAGPSGIVVAANGDVWFTESHGNKIGRLKNGHFIEYPVPTPDSQQTALAIGADGSVWFTEQSESQFGAIGHLQLSQDAK